MKLISVLFILCVFCQNVSAYKILGLCVMPSKSHCYIPENLLLSLAADGHEITYVSPYKYDRNVTNFQEVFLEEASIETAKSKQFVKKDYFENDLDEFLGCACCVSKALSRDNFAYLVEMNYFNMFFVYYDLVYNNAHWVSISKNLHQLLKDKPHFDVVITELIASDAVLGLGKYFDAPVIGYSAFAASTWSTGLVGTPNFASYVPHHYNPYTDRMTFWQRMLNSITFFIDDLLNYFYYTPKLQKLSEQLFPDEKNWPSIDELRRNVSLVLLNTHTTIGTPRPYAPNMIEVGGLQIKPTVDPLPAKIQKFLDDAQNGAIFLSLGSNVLINKMTKPHFEAITNAFSAFPNHRILIKSDEGMVIPSHKESDVLIEPWFPQQSILAHENVKLFVTHGGLLSSTEAVHFGKPVVGIPFFFDQHTNMNLAQQKGYGISVPIKIMNADNLKAAVDQVLGNPSYAEQAKIISERYRDQPMTPMETAKYWVNYVARHKGAPHLRSAAIDLPYYALYNLDVWGLIVGVIFIAIVVVVKVLKAISSIAFSLKSKDKRKKA